MQPRALVMLTVGQRAACHSVSLDLDWAAPQFQRSSIGANAVHVLA